MTPNFIPSQPLSLPVQADLHPLVERLGAGVSVLEVALPGGPIRDGASLRSFLDRYAFELLVPVELAVIHEAARLAACSKFREIIALDDPSKRKEWDPAFSEASRRSGKSQLRKLRSLRDVKGVKRYAEAVERGEAFGAHVVVYGVMLGLYSIPLRQGLSHYAWQTLHSLADAGADRLGLEGVARRALHQSLEEGHGVGIRESVERMMDLGLRLI